MVVLANIISHFLLSIIVCTYLVFIVFTIIKILLDTNSTPKTLAYILLVIVFPLLGMFFYFAFGINYRHIQTSKKTAIELDKLTKAYKNKVPDKTKELFETHHKILKEHSDLIHFIHSLEDDKLSINQLKLLINGEEKFPEVIKTLATAKHFIHMEYYIWEDDTRGNQIKDVLIAKAKQGVQVRVMYDDYASRGIIHNIATELQIAGVEIYPVMKVKLKALANRINHRDHRKVIIVDGHTGFIGGLNISDRYDNSIDTGLWWRDTHLKIIGETVHSLQRHFIVNWNACQPNKLGISKYFFPESPQNSELKNAAFAQIVAGGPIYSLSTIMLSYFKIFTVAKKKLYITNPYFIPNDSILDAIKQSAISGVDVRLILPEKSDSTIVNAASKFYYEQLLQAGVKIFLYNKGFVHAKTVVVDNNLSVVGTANLDIRSFELNFEIMSVIYGEAFAQQLEDAFMDDLKHCTQLKYQTWIKQGKLKKLTYATCRLVSSFL